MESIQITPLQYLIHKKITIPSSKSYTNRALVIASLAKGKSTIRNPLVSDDTLYMTEALKNLGMRVRLYKNRTIIEGKEARLKPKKKELFCGIGGTTSRFLTALVSLLSDTITITGEGKLLERPIYALVDALQMLGVDISYLGKKGSLPLQVKGGSFKKDHVTLSGTISSQFITALLLIAPLLKKGLTIEVVGKQISSSYIDITLQIMREFGVTVINNHYRSYRVGPRQYYKARNYTIEGDWSSASYFCAIAALHKGSLRIRNLNTSSSQGDAQFPKLLEAMGVSVYYEKDGVTVSGGTPLKPIRVDMETMPDIAPTLAVLASFAKGTSVITGLSSLRVKESNRLAAISHELLKTGIKTKITPSSLTIFGGVPHGASINTYHDHRLAMSFAVMATKIRGITIENPLVVNKSYPLFWKTLSSIGCKCIL